MPAEMIFQLYMCSFCIVNKAGADCKKLVLTFVTFGAESAAAQAPSGRGWLWERDCSNDRGRHNGDCTAGSQDVQGQSPPICCV